MTIPDSWLALVIGGVISGIFAGLLGIGGGTILGPLLIAYHYGEVESFATSGLAILITSTSGTIENWRKGYISPKQVIAIGLPALVTAQIGVVLANLAKSAPYVLLTGFGILSLVNVYLIDLKKHLTKQQPKAPSHAAEHQAHPTIASASSNQGNMLLSRLLTGGTAGLLAGLFGIGGGVVMVPMQILLMGESIKTAIQTSLGAVVLTAVSACIGHTLSGNILWMEGIILGLGGLVGAQISTRILPKLPDLVVSLIFRSYLGILSLFIFWKAWQSYQSSL